MAKRPHSVTVVGCLFLAAGVVGLAYHATDLQTEQATRYELWLVLFLRFLAVVFGIFLLRGSNWARWGALTWMAYHVVLSAFHSVTDGLIHALLFAAIAFVLLRPKASSYFQGARAGS